MDLFRNGNEHQLRAEDAVSLQASRAVWDKSRAQRGEKFVLLALADCVNGNSCECWPSERWLAERTGYSRRAVRRYLAALESTGEIVRKQVEGRRSATYQLTILQESSGDQSPDRTGDLSPVAAVVRAIRDRSAGDPRPGIGRPVTGIGRPVAQNLREPRKNRNELRARARARAGGTHEHGAPEPKDNGVATGPDPVTRRRLRSMFEPRQGAATSGARLSDVATATVLRLVRSEDHVPDPFPDALPHADDDAPAEESMPSSCVEDQDGWWESDTPWDPLWSEGGRDTDAADEEPAVAEENQAPPFRPFRTYHNISA